MSTRAEVGYCALSTSHSGAWHLQRAQYEPVRIAWLKGVAFVDTIDFYGSPITIKMADVDAISDVSPEVVQMRDAEAVVSP